MSISKRLLDLRADARGLSTVEYTVLLVLIVSGAIGAWKTLGGQVVGKVGEASTTFGQNVQPIQSDDTSGGGR